VKSLSCDRMKRLARRRSPERPPSFVHDVLDAGDGVQPRLARAGEVARRRSVTEWDGAGDDRLMRAARIDRDPRHAAPVPVMCARPAANLEVSAHAFPVRGWEDQNADGRSR